MDTVFVVQHSYLLDDDFSSEETKFIGVYSSQYEAEKAVERLKTQPGFDQLPEYFYIDEYQINQDSWNTGFVTLRKPKIYTVWKSDADGNTFLVQKGLVEADALRLIRDLEFKNDKYTFWSKEHA